MSIISIIGGTGFVGKHLTNALVNAGHTVNVFTRQIKKTAFNPNPHITLVEYDPHQIDQFTQQLKNTDILINLVGVFNTAIMQQKHVEFPLALLECAHKASIQKFIHFGALGASKEIALAHHKANSTYLRTKSHAEIELLERAKILQVPTTIVKPSVIFAQDDLFFTQFAGLCRALPIVLVPCPNSVLQPIYIDDLIKSLFCIFNDESLAYTSLELAGPKQYRLIELVKMVAHYNNLSSSKVIGMPKFMAFMMAKLIGWYPKAPFNYDQYLSLQVSNTSTQNTLEALNIQPTHIESVLPFRFRFNGKDRFESDREMAHR